jgi:hypothetical protein
MGKRYVSGEYNLFEYGRIIDTESLAARAISRKVSVTFRNGWSIKSENPRNLKRIKRRIQEMEFATSTEFEALLESIVRSLFLYNNCYVLITRSDKSSSSKGRDRRPPIAGLSVLPVETVDILLDPNGNILGYKQRVGAWKKEYGKDEVYHLSVDKRPGMILGTPPLEYVKDDIIALRKIEENIELLIDRSIFPLLHARVGTEKNPASILDNGVSEVDDIAYKLEMIDKTGGLATNERVEITAIGAESLALRVEGYLNYFKSRVLIGLGVSAVDLGEDDSSGKTAGDVLSLNLIDTVEQYQGVVETFFKKIFVDMMIDDSLIKNQYSVEEEDFVLLDFNATSQDKDVKIGSHYSDMYTKGVITVDEARSKIGHKPVSDKQNKDFFHKRTEKLEKPGAPANPVAKSKPPEKKTKDSIDTNIPIELLTSDMKNYSLSKVIKLIDNLDYGIEDQGLLIIAERVLDRLLTDITICQDTVAREESIRYIME